MKIQSFYNSNYNCPFYANINSPKLRFKQEDSFVNIRGYGKNRVWAKSVKSTTDTAVNLIRKNSKQENILKLISIGVRKANLQCSEITKILHSGILRTKRDGWLCHSDWSGLELWTDYSQLSRYKNYRTRLNKIAHKKLTNPYDDMELTVPIIDEEGASLRHCSDKYINNAFKHITEIYGHFKQSFNSKEINNSQMKDVNSDIAEIRWILDHSMPWERGSDAISNIFMRAMYKSIGIKSYPLKKGISLDLEAFCTELKDYKAKFPSFFEKPPEIID